MTTSAAPTFGFFTRLLDDGNAATRYDLARRQILRAEELGFATAWVAQHHFHPLQGGLPSPFVFLAGIAAVTRQIRLATGIITLPLENTIRLSEDAAVFDVISNGRLELGVGPGGTSESFEAFGLDGAQRGSLMEDGLEIVRSALNGAPFKGGAELYPPAPTLAARIWQATFSTYGGARAGRAGDGLMLSRTQARPRKGDDGQADLSLDEIQNPIIDSYLAALGPDHTPRILASRSVFVATNREAALEQAVAGIMRFREENGFTKLEPLPPASGDFRAWSAWLRAQDFHVGTADDVIRSLSDDSVLQRATEVAFQIHPADPPHPVTMTSIELIAKEVAPALGLRQR